MRTFAMIALIAVGLLTPGKTSAQSADATFLPDYARAAITGTSLPDANGIQQVECASCGTMKPPSYSSGCSSCGGGGVMCSDGCASGLCKPGRTCKFTGNCGNGFIDNFFGGLGECLCCSDPCYEPVWNTTANAAFWQDNVRPKTYTRFRYDNFNSMSAPKIAEYFMGSSATGGNGRTVNSQELSMYQEVAADKASFFIEMPYRSIDFQDGHNAGFVDLNLGTKSLLLDCDLLQMTFQFKTFIPVGNAASGTGTGHVSLEPSLLFSLKLFDATYLQSQFAYWIPIGGDADASGTIFHYHFSFNHLFVERGPWQVIGTAEFNAWNFLDGTTTIGNDNTVFSASHRNYINAGPGLRIVYCENYDLGLGYACALSDGYLGQNQYRAELRIRY